MLLSLLLLSCGRANPDPAVIIVVLDGVRAEDSLGDRVSSATGLWPQEMLPKVWEELVPQGARASAAFNIGITITAPAHCEMLSGQRVALANYPDEGDDGAYRPELPSLAEVLRAELGLPASQAAIMGNTMHIEPTAHSLWPGADWGASFSLVLDDPEDAASNLPARDDRDVIAALRQRLRDDAPRLALVNLHGVDRIGHYGDGDDYPSRLSQLDESLVALWDDIRRDRAYQNGYLVLVSDHGRHRESADEPPWREHGDSCMGCRHVPLLILGPDVAAGTVTDAPVLLSDLAPTFAALMGVEMPWADGRLLDEMFTVDLGERLGGVSSVAAAGGAVAVSRLRADPYHRSEIEVDGVVLSSPDVLAAEAPTMAADGAGAWLCFREITVDVDADAAPWVPRCFARPAGGGWSALPAPEAEVSPFWRPALVPDGSGGLLAAWNDNRNGHAGASGADGPIGLTVGHYRPDSGWQLHQPLRQLSFPIWPAIASDGEAVVAAVAAAEEGPEARNRRSIFAASGAVGEPLGAGGPAMWVEAAEPWRLERPALTLEAGVPWMAAVGYHGDEAVVLVSRHDGEGWQSVAQLTGDGAVLPHLRPLWVPGPRLLFGTLRADGPSLCLAEPEGETRCAAVDSVGIRDLATDGEAAYAVVEGAGEWAVSRIALGELWR